MLLKISPYFLLCSLLFGAGALFVGCLPVSAALCGVAGLLGDFWPGLEVLVIIFTNLVTWQMP